MANTTAMSPGTLENYSISGNVAWVNLDNAKVSDGEYTTVTLLEEKSYILKATNFGFSIPSGSTINGILAEVEAKTGSDTLQINRGFIKGETILTPPGSLYFNTTEQYLSLGGATDLLGITWTADEINSSNFGVFYQSALVTTETIFIDHIRITIYYTEPPTTTGVGSITGVQSITF